MVKIRQDALMSSWEATDFHGKNRGLEKNRPTVEEAG
jgi:hypothetical protein